jgi:gas vesicle protein
LAFDVVSFIIGLAAGALVGALAGYLHETETIGELQERVRMATVQLEKATSTIQSGTSEGPIALHLRHQIQDLQDEIKRMYRKSNR